MRFWKDVKRYDTYGIIDFISYFVYKDEKSTVVKEVQEAELIEEKVERENKK